MTTYITFDPDDIPEATRVFHTLEMGQSTAPVQSGHTVGQLWPRGDQDGDENE